jgi:hypothetical protein
LSSPALLQDDGNSEDVGDKEEVRKEILVFVYTLSEAIDAGGKFKEASHRGLAGKVKDIIIITKLMSLQTLAISIDLERIRVLTIPYANRRLWTRHRINNATTDIIVLANEHAI